MCTSKTTQALHQTVIDYQAGYKLLSIAEVVTRYTPRTTATKTGRRGMTLEEGQKIESMFKALRGKVTEIPCYEWEGLRGPFGCKLGRLPDSFAYMEQCWFEPFYTAFGLMRDKLIERSHRRLDRAYSRLMEEGYDEEDEEYEENQEDEDEEDQEENYEEEQEEDD